MRLQKISLTLLSFVIAGIFVTQLLHAETITPTPTTDPSTQQSNIGDCATEHLNANDCVTYYQNKLTDAQGQEKTLSSQINLMDSQIKLTEARIEATKEQILSLEEDIDTAKNKISGLESSFADLTKILVNRMIAGYEVGSQNPFQLLLASDSINNFFTRMNYLTIVEQHDKKLAYDTVQAKNDYANQQQIFEDKKRQVLGLQVQLRNYTANLSTQKSAKQELLTETQGNEATYQNLLAQAKAQLEGFSSFAQNNGGASLLSNQTICDDWGCYYNQRDSQWGNIALNRTQYSIASDGCLLTSMAMMYTHYGHRNVTPVSINSDPNNFASYYPAFLKYTVTADGATSNRVGGYIDNTLASGNPVIVGIRYASGDTHFVVLTGGSNGNYMMNDPFVPNGHQIAFSSHYTMGSIFEVDKVVF